MFRSIILQKVSGNTVVRIRVPVAVQKPPTEEFSHTRRRQCQTSRQDTHPARLCLTNKSFSGEDPCAEIPHEHQPGKGRLASGGVAEEKAARSEWCSSLNQTMSWLGSGAAPCGSWLLSLPPGTAACRKGEQKVKLLAATEMKSLRRHGYLALKGKCFLSY